MRATARRIYQPLRAPKSERVQIKQLGIREFYEKRHKILIRRGTGGVGDILMHRMMFEDFKRVMPEMELHFACPKRYIPISSHPYVDEVVDCNEVMENDYMVSYDTTVACGRYENAIAPLSGLHRSDIWSQHCGVILLKHNMHLNLSDEVIQHGHDEVNRCRMENYGKLVNGPAVCLCPVSASMGKNLLEEQIVDTVKGLREMGLMVFLLHTHKLEMDVACPQLHGYSFMEWLGVINAVDYVVSVDTGAFHAAGGLKKPMVGIFTWADGKVYGKYYSNWELVQRHRDNGDWDCGPCYNWAKCPKVNSVKQPHKPCLTELTAEEIVAATKRLILRNEA